jgi:hypothetical protein
MINITITKITAIGIANCDQRILRTDAPALGKTIHGYTCRPGNYLIGSDLPDLMNF